MTRWLYSIVTLILVLAVALAGYRLARAQIAGEVYRQRLVGLQGDYDQLRDAYNQAVSKTAVTQLLVKDGRVSIVIRNAAGKVRTIPTPFDPDHEIYVDYVVVDGRLWIRRVFDDKTPPDQGVTVDPKVAHVDWNAAGAAYGKAAYRRLTPGRWIITVTGDGALGLAKCDTCSDEGLTNAPRLKKHHPIEGDARAKVDGIGPMDVLWHLVGG